MDQNRLSPETVDAGWRQLGEFAETMQRRADSDGAWTIHRGSALAGDDKFMDPFQSSHLVQSLMHASIDQLHAIAALVLNANALHTYAGASLVRTSLETATHAAWLVLPADRSTRLLRSVRSRNSDLADRHTALSEMGFTDLKTDERRSQLRTIVDRHQLDPSTAMKPVNTTQIMREASSEFTIDLGRLPIDIWRIASGFAHGRQWASLAFLEREVRHTADPGILNVRFSMGTGRLLLLAVAAQSVLVEAIRLYELRGTRPVPPSAKARSRSGA